MIQDGCHSDFMKRINSNRGSLTDLELKCGLAVAESRSQNVLQELTDHVRYGFGLYSLFFLIFT